MWLSIVIYFGLVKVCVWPKVGVNICYFVVRNWGCGLLAVSGFQATAASDYSLRLLGFSLLVIYCLNPCGGFVVGLKPFHVYFLYVLLVICYRKEPLLMLCLHKWRLIFLCRALI